MKILRVTLMLIIFGLAPVFASATCARDMSEWAPFAEAKAWAHANNVRGTSMWKDMHRDQLMPANFPSNPNLVYADEFISWEDFTGYAKPKPMPYADAFAWTAMQNFESSTAYKQAIRDGLAPEGLPIAADYVYAYDWQSWAVYLGKKRPQRR